MKARSVVTGAVAAMAMVIGGAVSASANIAWCSADPPARTVTGDGANLTVNTYVTVLKPEVHYLNDFQSEASSAPDGRGGTLITVRVYVPAGLGSARVTSSVNRYQVSASAVSTGGSVVTLVLDVPKS
jgi:hypothetical protein